MKFWHFEELKVAFANTTQALLEIEIFGQAIFITSWNAEFDNLKSDSNVFHPTELRKDVFLTNFMWLEHNLFKNVFNGPAILWQTQIQTIE